MSSVFAALGKELRQSLPERKHSKFSASGAERWMNCPGSVALSEGLPDKSSPYAIEGTEAHAVLEDILKSYIEGKSVLKTVTTQEMIDHGENSARFIFALHRRLEGSDILVESRIKLDFIHPEMFGTFDGAVIDHFGTLHVFDYKYGAGVPVSPGTEDNPNFQMLFYGIGLAHQYQWNFKRIRLWIIQPRVKSFDGPLYLEMTVPAVKSYIIRFERGVRRVEEKPDEFVEGKWCHWCKAKSICPLKRASKRMKDKDAFSMLRARKLD